MIFSKAKWLRVNKNVPCALCNSFDWCTLTDDGKFACCMRVQSAKPMKNGGWLHNLKEELPRAYIQKAKVQESVNIDVEMLYQKWKRNTEALDLIMFAERLGVNPQALNVLECVWAGQYKAWCFPMKDAKGAKIGVRLRNEQGEKWAVTGSHAGLFIPTPRLFPKDLNDDLLLICEGPTDAAAGLSLGYYVIGRPSCLGQEKMIIDFIRINKFKRVVIIADNDTPGLNGADKLQKELKVPSCIATLPCKDLRQFVQKGGTKELLECILKSLVWSKPRV